MGVGVGKAGVAEGEGVGDALGLAGDCADKFATGFQATKARMNRETSRDISGPILSRNRVQSNIPPVMASLEMDLRDCFVGARAGRGNGIAERRHG